MNIVIAGGGTAGWLAAYIISKTQPNKHNITVVASSKIGIIGAGENATGLFKDILSGVFFEFKVDMADFMEKTEATYKNGILNVNWGKDGSSYFTPLGCCPSWKGVDDYIFKYALSYDKENIHMYSESGYLYGKNRWEEDLQSFHFNSFKAGEFLKNICLKDGVTVLDSIIKEVILDTNGNIESLRVEDDTLVSGDLFIDATGFSRILMNKLNVGWKSYKEYLPVDRAIPFFLSDPELMSRRYTTATALSSGWMWNVPLQTRVGAGYTYDSNFLSEDEAINEVEVYLGYKVNPIKVIKFDAGRTNQTWVKNCIATGLSQSFVEPLEATSIHTTIMQLLTFVNDCLLDTKDNTITDVKRNRFNHMCSIMNDNTLDFISLHYQGGRTDSPFWKHMTDNYIATDMVKEIIERSKTSVPGVMQYPSALGTAPICLWLWNLAGLNLLSPEVAKISLEATGRTERAIRAKEEFNRRLG
jgi:tryptophan halogenase